MDNEKTIKILEEIRDINKEALKLNNELSQKSLRSLKHSRIISTILIIFLVVISIIFY